MRNILILRTARRDSTLFISIAMIAIFAGSVAGADVPKPFNQKVPAAKLAEIEMLPVPAGSFDVPGKDGQPKSVAIKPIWMSKTEITWDQFDPFYSQWALAREQQRRVDVAPWTDPTEPPYFENPDHGFGHEHFAVLHVSCLLAGKYCEWLSAKTGKKYRLPTEAEWEYVCRAGKTKSPLKPDEVQAIAWVKENANAQTHRVATKPANAWGFHDMLGNAAEWADDGTPKGILCGGSYLDDAEEVQPTWRATYKPAWQIRDPNEPNSKWWYTDAPFAGFRIVCEP